MVKDMDMGTEDTIHHFRVNQEALLLPTMG